MNIKKKLYLIFLILKNKEVIIQVHNNEKFHNILLSQLKKEDFFLDTDGDLRITVNTDL